MTSESSVNLFLLWEMKLPWNHGPSCSSHLVLHTEKEGGDP